MINESRGGWWAGPHSLCFALCHCPGHGSSLAGLDVMVGGGMCGGAASFEFSWVRSFIMPK